MTATTNQAGTLERELLLCSTQRRAELLSSLANFLVDNTSLDLEEVPCSLPNDQQKKNNLEIRLYRQGNAKASRKQVVPFMMEFFCKG
jgi:inorganic pyrophosphatase/exopolyphosphatase